MNNNVPQPPVPQPCPAQAPVQSQPETQTPLYGSPQYGTQQTYVYSPMPEKTVSPRRQALDRATGGLSTGIAVILSVVFGALYCRLIFKGGLGIGATAITALFYIIFGFLFVKRDRIFSLANLVTAIPTLVLAASFSFNASHNGRFWAILTLIGMFMINTSVLSFCADKSLSSTTLTDSLVTHTLGTIENIPGTFAAVFKRGSKSDGSRLRGSMSSRLIYRCALPDQWHSKI